MRNNDEKRPINVDRHLYRASSASQINAAMAGIAIAPIGVNARLFRHRAMRAAVNARCHHAYRCETQACEREYIGEIFSHHTGRFETSGGRAALGCIRRRRECVEHILAYFKRRRPDGRSEIRIEAGGRDIGEPRHPFARFLDNARHEARASPRAPRRPRGLGRRKTARAGNPPPSPRRPPQPDPSRWHQRG